MAEATQTPPGMGPETEPPEDFGDDVLERIAQRRAEEMTGQQPARPAAPADAATGTQEAGEHQAGSTEDDEPPRRQVLTEGLDQVFVRAKINGHEMEVPVSEALKHYQIDGAAEQRLQNAKQLEAQLKADREAFERLKAEQPQQSPEGQPAPAAPERRQAFRKLMDAWADLGPEDDLPEDAEALLDSLLTGPAVDPRQVARQVMAQLSAQDLQREADEAVAWYQSEHAALAGDPVLDNITAQFLDAEMADGKGFRAALEGAVQKTQDWLSARTGQAAQNPAPTSAAAKRQQAQQTLRNAPPTASSLRPGPTPPRQQSIEEARRAAIDEMMANNL